MAVLALTACGGASQVAPGATVSASGTAVAQQEVSPAPSAATGTVPSPASDPGAGASGAAPADESGVEPFPLILQTDGLGYVINESTFRQVTFGDDAARVRTLVSGALGGPLKRSALDWCAEGPRTSFERDNFRIFVVGKKFVGWEDGGSDDRRFATLDGAGVGSTIEQMTESVADIETRIDDSVLGNYFVTKAGDFGGFLDAEGKRVQSLWAGETCTRN